MTTNTSTHLTANIVQAIAIERKITGIDVGEDGEILRIDLDGSISIYLERGKVIQVEASNGLRAV
jgi:hypothetical protein